MEQLPLVSVIMPAYNAGPYIATAIASVVEQTYAYWELIVVDDGSTDNTAIIVQAAAQQDKRVHYLYQENGRQGKARNTGIRHATGGLIAFLDADDAWLEHKLDHQVQSMSAHNADLIFSDVYVIDVTGAIIKGTWHVQDDVYEGYHGLRSFFEGNQIPLVSVMVKKDCLLAVYGFSESGEIQYGEDYALWLRLLLNGAVFKSSSERLAYYRMHDQQATYANKSALQVIKAIAALPVSAPNINSLRKKSIVKWTRNWLRTVRPYDRPALQQVLQYYPYALPRVMLSYLLRVANVEVSRFFFDKLCSITLNM